MDHDQIEWLTKLNGSHREWNSGLRSKSLGSRFSHASRNMAARTPDSGGGEADERDDHGGGDPKQIVRSCAESLLTALARLQEGERHRTQTSVARSSTWPADTCTSGVSRILRPKTWKPKTRKPKTWKPKTRKAKTLVLKRFFFN